MSDWIANDENEYVKKAITFSANLKRLSEIKKNLRQIALESPVFNASLFAEQLNIAVCSRSFGRNKHLRQHLDHTFLLQKLDILG